MARRRKKVSRAKSNPNGVQAWKEKVDTVFSQYIRLRDSDENGRCKCFTCNYEGFWKGDGIQNGHFRSRRYNSTRYDEMNNHAQCVICNVNRSGEQYLYGKKLDELYGEGTADDLVRKSQEHVKYTVVELTEMFNFYSEEVRKLLIEKQLL